MGWVEAYTNNAYVQRRLYKKWGFILADRGQHTPQYIATKPQSAQLQGNVYLLLI